jgi:hypothetical protein
MNILSVNSVHTPNLINNIKNINTTSLRVSFGDKEGSIDTISGDKYQLNISSGYQILLNIENRSKENEYTRFLLLPKDEKYSQLVIIAAPRTDLKGLNNETFSIRLKPKKQDTNYKDYTLSPHEELEAAKKTFSHNNPPKQTIKDAKKRINIIKDESKNIFFERETEKLFNQFCAEYNLNFSNAVVYAKSR